MRNRHVFEVLSLALLCAGFIAGQMNRGTVTGVVTDPSGAVVPGVKIVVVNTATRLRVESLSNEAGQYSVPNLQPGPYAIEFMAASFKKFVRGGLDLGAAQVLRIDAMLEVGQVTDSVSVVAESPRIQSETREVATSISSREMADLPLSFANARSPEYFAYKLSPGVSGGFWTSHINGSVSFSKDVLVDGASATTQMGGDFSTGMISPEAIGEFKVIASGMSAEFGRSQGGLFNFVLKSGTNEAHGCALGILRNEGLNANSFSNNFNGIRRPLDRKQDFGFSLGGPVYLPKVYNGRNRTFFYVTYERYRERNFGFRAPDRTLPVPEFYAGDFSRLLGPVTGQRDASGRDVLRGAIYDPATFVRRTDGRWIGDMFPGNVIPQSRFSQVSRRVSEIATRYYLPTVRDASGRIALVNNSTFPVATAPVYDNHQFTVKADQSLTAAQRLSFSWTRSVKDRSVLADAGGPYAAGTSDGGPFSSIRSQYLGPQYGRLAHDYILRPTVINHANLSFNYLSTITRNLNSGVNGARELGIRNLSTIGYPVINWGAGPIVGLANLGDPTYGTRYYMQWGYLDTVSFQAGRHFMKAGVDIRRNSLNVGGTAGGTLNFAPRATAIPGEPFSGNLTGYSMASFLLGVVDSAGLGDPTVLGGRRRYYAFFLQDDFKAAQRLTLQLGMRWEYQPPMFEVADRMSSWNPDKTDPVSGLKGAYDFAGKCKECTGKRSFGRRSLRDWGPRVGFAYRLTEKMTIRGGYGLFFVGDVFNGYAAVPLGKPQYVQWGGAYALAADPVQPWFGLFNWDNGFPTGRYVPPSYDASWGNRNGPARFDPNYGRTPYVQEWNFNVQREVWRRVVVDVGYIANKSTGLYNGELTRLNQIDPKLIPQFGRNLNNPVRNPAEAAANGIAYPFPGFSGTVASALRPHPQVVGNGTVGTFGAPVGFAHYHSLQVTVNRQFKKGLSVFGNFVWSKTLSNTASEQIGDNPGSMDYYNLKLEKAIVSYDQPRMFKAYVDYELPIGRGKAFLGGAGRLVNLLAGGWSMSAILNYFDGGPLGFGGSSPLPGAWNGGGNRANVAAGVMRAAGFNKDAFNFADLFSPGNTYLNKGLFSDPAPLTFGSSAPRYVQLRGFGTINEDIGIVKNIRFAEKYRFQLRGELLNAFNRHFLSGVNTGVNTPLFGQVTGVGGMRNIQLGARLDF